MSNNRLSFLEKILEKSVNEIYVFNPTSLKFLYINMRGITNLGYSYDRLENMTPLEISPEFTKVSFLKKIAPLISGKINSLQYKTTHKRKDNSTYPVKINLEHILSSNNKIIVAYVQDITNIEKEIKEHRVRLEKDIKIRTESLDLQKEHLKRSQKALSFLLEDMDEAREELLIANQYMRAANEELESFSYSVSHDLRSPLTRLDGFSKALLDLYGDKIDEKGKHYLERIRVSSQHMAALINDLLSLSRITRSDINKQKVNLSDISNKIIDEIKETNKARITEIQVEEGLMAFGDKTLIKSLLENLISNAFKFSRNKDITIIEIGKTIHKDNIYFFVKDNGEGFDMQYYNKLFAVFQRLHSNEEFPGTGIGLASVSRIISKHNGKIHAESEIGKGATFYFTLSLMTSKRD